MQSRLNNMEPQRPKSMAVTNFPFNVNLRGRKTRKTGKFLRARKVFAPKILPSGKLGLFRPLVIVFQHFWILWIFLGWMSVGGILASGGNTEAQKQFKFAAKVFKEFFTLELIAASTSQIQSWGQPQIMEGGIFFQKKTTLLEASIRL